jgi:hypothetical protein
MDDIQRTRRFDSDRSETLNSSSVEMNLVVPRQTSYTCRMNDLAKAGFGFLG